MADNDRRDDRRGNDKHFFIIDDDNDFDIFDDDEDFGRLDLDGELNQDVEQESESGDVDQTFEVTGSGDNSNQCVGTQVVANTGNAQNVVGLTQLKNRNNH